MNTKLTNAHMHVQLYMHKHSIVDMYVSLSLACTINELDSGKLTMNLSTEFTVAIRTSYLL